jgi:hypothetical protein
MSGDIELIVPIDLIYEAVLDSDLCPVVLIKLAELWAWRRLPYPQRTGGLI